MGWPFWSAQLDAACLLLVPTAVGLLWVLLTEEFGGREGGGDGSWEMGWELKQGAPSARPELCGAHGTGRETQAAGGKQWLCARCWHGEQCC